ncbi:sulfate permease [Calidifontibacter sp. DB0510]|uniref:Sulfate permease n=1 Tax=Metallococcus carri TaxID=1656884 RepID=A0A967EAF1_9MICO|nr:sulfate permease [Metallococcus carri]NHN55819.1 sulfate permease [Metallococcus carri]NOP38493.1 sulfate permease [Calidifontibacter sp. DB2511S]
MLFAASWSLSSRLHGAFQSYALSNIVIRRVHTRSGIKWGALVGAFGVVVYGAVMVGAVALLHDGAPGWINLIVLIAFWNIIKFAVLVPVSVVRLLRVRHQERAIVREYERRAGVTATNA